MRIAELVARLLLAGKGRSEEEYKEYLQIIAFVPTVVIVLAFSFSLEFGIWFWGALIAACAVLAVAQRRDVLLLAAVAFIAARFAINLVLTQRTDALIGTIVSVGLLSLLVRRLNR